MKRAVSTSYDRPALIAVLAVLVMALAAFALVPTGSASALPPAQPTGTIDPTEPPEDVTLPEITFPMPGGGYQGWFSGTTILSVSATDPGPVASGVTSFSYALTGATTRTGNLSAAGDAITISNGGHTTVTITAVDGNGNQDSAQRVIGVDRDMPNLSVATPTHNQTFRQDETATVSFTCNDAYTGIKACSSSTQTLDTATVGQKNVTFTATDNVGNTRSQTVSYRVVENEWEATTMPTLTGAGKVGTTLTVNPGTYVPAPTTRAYVWYRDGVVIPGVTGTSYLLTAQDAGADLYAEESVAGAGYPTWVYGTNMVDPILLGDLAQLTAPTISGTAKVGQVLSVGGATFEPAATTVTYRWTRDGAAITGATGSTYRLVAADAGRRISVDVTAARAGYATYAVATAPTPKVVAAAGQMPGGAKAKAMPSLVAKVKVLKKGKARVNLRVTVPQGTADGGTVTVKRGAKVLRAGVVVKNGVAKAVVKKLPRGKKVRLTVTYSGTAKVAAASTKTKRVRIR